MEALWTKCIGNNRRHSAFTDLLYFNDLLYCCYREATNHVSGDGKVKILTLTLSGKTIYQQSIRIPLADLRDPKLSISPEGKLFLHAQARFPNEHNQTKYSQGICWFSSDGFSWSQGKFFGDKNWWLWRICWNNGNAIGFAYNRGHQSISLYQGNPQRTFELTTPEALSLAKHGKGYPNESDIIFLNDGTAVSIVRRDADTYTAQLGKSLPPYRKWQWQDLNTYIGGPAMMKLNEDKAIVAGRTWKRKGPVTQLLLLDIASAQLSPLIVLESAGDCSYPGLAMIDKHLYVSYYSSHEGKSNIYLSKIVLNNLSSG